MRSIEKYQARVSDRTARRLEQYEAMFGNIAISSGQLVLNLGAGDSTLSTELNEQHINVIDIDYGYSKLPPLFSEGEKRQIAYEGNAVAASADTIPIKNDSIDVTFASYLLMHLNSEQVQKTLDELLRVSKPGANIYLGPIYEDAAKNIEQTVKSTLSLREATHRDGWDRKLHSAVLKVPSNNNNIDTTLDFKTLAQSGIFGNKPKIKMLGRLAGHTVDTLIMGNNRRYDTASYEIYAL